jgi:4-diphosphocytidyl-2-C-methyl-D-erythritol kinase
LSTGYARARRLELSAAAKVNLTLEVLGRRGDGYHEVRTVMQTIDLADRVALEECDAIELTTKAPGVPTDSTNLAMKAALALRDAARIEHGVRIALDKRIPVAGGLGGGSTDAAAVLLGLNRLWRLRWPLARLEEIAVTLGMDVPFFLRGGAALGTGRGECLKPLQTVGLSLVLVSPGIAVSTAETYGRLTPATHAPWKAPFVLAARPGLPITCTTDWRRPWDPSRARSRG